MYARNLYDSVRFEPTKKERGVGVEDSIYHEQTSQDSTYKEFRTINRSLFSQEVKMRSQMNHRGMNKIMMTNQNL